MLSECGDTLRWEKAHQGGFTSEQLAELTNADEAETEKRVRELAVEMKFLEE